MDIYMVSFFFMITKQSNHLGRSCKRYFRQNVEHDSRNDPEYLEQMFGKSKVSLRHVILLIGVRIMCEIHTHSGGQFHSSLSLFYTVSYASPNSLIPLHSSSFDLIPIRTRWKCCPDPNWFGLNLFRHDVNPIFSGQNWVGNRKPPGQMPFWIWIYSICPSSWHDLVPPQWHLCFCQALVFAIRQAWTVVFFGGRHEQYFRLTGGYGQLAVLLGPD